MSQSVTSDASLIDHIASARDQVRYGWPANWLMVVATAAAIFFWHGALGADTAPLGGAFAASWLGLAALAVWSGTGRTPLRMTVSLYVLGFIFLALLVAIASQLTPYGIGGAHPLWDSVEGAMPATTLDRDATWRELIKLTSLGGAFLCGLLIGRGDRRTKLFFDLFLLFAGGYAAVSLFDFFRDPNLIFGMPHTLHPGRLSGSYTSADSAAALYGIFGIVAAARLAQALKEHEAESDARPESMRSLIQKCVIAFAVLGLSAVCLVLTESRAGIAATGLTLLLLLAWEVRVVSSRGTRARGVAIAFGLAAIVVVGAAVARIITNEGGLASLYGDAARRLVVYQAHWEAFQISPWMGYGLGSFTHVNDLMQTSQNWQDLAGMDRAHNVALQWLSETGAIGSALMALTLLMLLVITIQGMARRRTMKTWLRVALAISALIGFHSLADGALQAPAFAGQWAVLLGVAAGLATSASVLEDAPVGR